MLCISRDRHRERSPETKHLYSNILHSSPGTLCLGELATCLLSTLTWAKGCDSLENQNAIKSGMKMQSLLEQGSHQVAHKVLH